MFFPPFHVASPTCFLDLILNNTLRMLSLSSLSKTLLSISVPCLDFYSINYNLQVFLFVCFCLFIGLLVLLSSWTEIRSFSLTAISCGSEWQQTLEYLLIE